MKQEIKDLERKISYDGKELDKLRSADIDTKVEIKKLQETVQQQADEIEKLKHVCDLLKEQNRKVKNADRGDMLIKDSEEVKKLMEARLYPIEGWMPKEITITEDPKEWTQLESKTWLEMQKDLQEARKERNKNFNLKAEYERKFFFNENFILKDLLGSRQTHKVLNVLALKKEEKQVYLDAGKYEVQADASRERLFYVFEEKFSLVKELFQLMG